MRVYIKTYDLSKWRPDPETIKWCRTNNFSTGRICDGNMHCAIRDDLNKCLVTQEGHLMVVHNGERFVGWGIVYDINAGHYKNELQIYVPPRMRRMGIGSKILKKAIFLRGKVRVYPHRVNEGFYEKFGLTANEQITGRKFINT